MSLNNNDTSPTELLCERIITRMPLRIKDIEIHHEIN